MNHKLRTMSDLKAGGGQPRLLGERAREACVFGSVAHLCSACFLRRQRVRASERSSMSQFNARDAVLKRLFVGAVESSSSSKDSVDSLKGGDVVILDSDGIELECRRYAWRRVHPLLIHAEAAPCGTRSRSWFVGLSARCQSWTSRNMSEIDSCLRLRDQVTSSRTTCIRRGSREPSHVEDDGPRVFDPVPG